MLATHGKPKPVTKQEVLDKPTLKEFASRFLERYAKANRLKPSGIAAKRTILQVHLIPGFGDKTLDAITTEHVQELKSALAERSPKTVNNVLTTLSVVLKTAVEWGVISARRKARRASMTLASTNGSWRRRVPSREPTWLCCLAVKLACVAAK